MTELQTCYVYALVDPRTNEVRYIGQTNDLKRRMEDHMYRPGAAALKAWIAELKATHSKPLMVTLQKTNQIDAANIEQNWLQAFKVAGAPLINRSRYLAHDYRAAKLFRSKRDN